eukprot:m.258144 g.258144  ORF g.258144 m.258144 type:complete len:75 (+) comp36183_c0_seq1:298-522(+)
MSNRANDTTLKAMQAQVDQLRKEEKIERVKVSIAAQSIKQYCNQTRDPLVPSVWGKPDAKANHFQDKGGKCTIL